MSLVLDSSATLAFIYSDETTESTVACAWSRMSAAETRWEKTIKMQSKGRWRWRRGGPPAQLVNGLL